MSISVPCSLSTRSMIARGKSPNNGAHDLPEGRLVVERATNIASYKSRVSPWRFIISVGAMIGQPTLLYHR